MRDAVLFRPVVSHGDPKPTICANRFLLFVGRARMTQSICSVNTLPRPTHLRDIGAFCEDFAIDEDWELASLKRCNRLPPVLGFGYRRHRAGIHSCSAECPHQGVNVRQVDSKDQCGPFFSLSSERSASPLTCTVQVCSHDELVDRVRVDVLRQ